jgi:hypothetical protein
MQPVLQTVLVQHLQAKAAAAKVVAAKAAAAKADGGCC